MIKVSNRLGTRSRATNICTKKLPVRQRRASEISRLSEGSKRVCKTSAEEKRSRKCLFGIQKAPKKIVSVEVIPIEREKVCVNVRRIKESTEEKK